MLHYLARTGYAAGLEAAVVFSAPWDYEETLRSLEQPINAVVIHGPFMVFLRQLVHRWVPGQMGVVPGATAGQSGVRWGQMCGWGLLGTGQLWGDRAQGGMGQVESLR